MIRLRELLKEETFTATNKKTGHVSVFKSKESRDTAIKAGTHAATKDKGSGAPKNNTVSSTTPTGKADNVIKGLKPTRVGGKYSDSLESGGSLYRINKKGQAVRDREVRLKDITPEDVSNTEKLFGVDLSKGMETGLDDKTNTLIIQYKRLQQFDKGGEFESKENYNSLLNLVKQNIAKDYTKDIAKAEKKKALSGKYASKYDEPSYWKVEKDNNTTDTKLTSDHLDKVQKAVIDDLKLKDKGFETTRESGGGAGEFEGPMTIIDKDADYDKGFNSLSIGSGDNDGKFSIGFTNQDGEALFDGGNYGSLTGNTVLTPQQAYKMTKVLMAMPEVQKFIKGEMSVGDFKSINDKIKSSFTKK